MYFVPLSNRNESNSVYHHRFIFDLKLLALIMIKKERERESRKVERGYEEKFVLFLFCLNRKRRRKHYSIFSRYL